MFKIVALLILLIRLPHEITSRRACKPNTQFIFNGRLCFCDNMGYWMEANCKTINRRQSCQPGQIIWQGCNQCICQENGYLVCSNSHCSDDIAKSSALRQGLSTYGLRCTPFRSYYINCSICVCPASGNTNEAQCVPDISCNAQNYRIEIGGNKKTYCIPNVLYLSTCMQCLCPEHGYFAAESCVDKCKQTTSLLPTTERRCNAGTLYRSGCNVCRCPNDGVVNDSLCISAVCNNVSLNSLRTDDKRCTPHSFTSPRCMYCKCHSTGIVNENACIELDCAKTKQLGKHSSKVTCHPGEMVPICSECFCPRNGQAVAKYCSSLCSYQNRINILEIVLKDAADFNVIEWSHIKRVRGNENCTPNTLYIADGRYCLCPDNGKTNFKFCTSITEDIKPLENHELLSNNVEIDYNIPCEPNTFIEFDCNTCYCARNGKIDPKWCTYDNCDAKRLILESHKIHNPTVATEAPATCQPGAVSKLKCNFCICPESGILKEKACTQNDCSEFDHSMYNDKLTCEPLAYYEVDCNICYCPRNGIKNVAKCTKNLCAKSALRSDSCIPGQLFSDSCNVCVCPPDGNKMGKTCTNHVCLKVVSAELLNLSDDLIENHISINHTRSLDQCFPGEEFVDGCKLCICPELGLKMYATCESVLCDDKTRNNKQETTSNSGKKAKNISGVKTRRNSDECYLYNITITPERQECTPGTMYIIRCRQCICPYFGNINNFCRPLPKNMFCEQAFPYFNYKAMGRRDFKAEIENHGRTESLIKVPNEDTNKTNTEESIQVRVKHDKHTEYECDRPGTILDRCFICDCDERNVIIEEHCFKSDSYSCRNAKPAFILKNIINL